MWNLSAPPEFQGLRDDLPLTVYFRHLPHWRQEGATYFVTFRLIDALPKAKLHELVSVRKLSSDVFLGRNRRWHRLKIANLRLSVRPRTSSGGAVALFPRHIAFESAYSKPRTFRSDLIKSVKIVLGRRAFAVCCLGRCVFLSNQQLAQRMKIAAQDA